MKTPTPHNSAKLGDFAKTVIMPGDPKRSEYIANKFLTDVVLVNDVRGVKGYTGFYKGKKVSVMAHGMGMPSMAIYAHELYNFYNVESIIRVGSCGAINEEVKLRDVILVSPSVTENNIYRVFKNNSNIAYPDKSLAKTTIDVAKHLNLKIKQGTVLCSDMFYAETGDAATWKQKGALGVEMESFVLYKVAEEYNKKAVCLLTVSDLLFDNSKFLKAEERQNSFDEMIKLSLDVAIQN